MFKRNSLGPTSRGVAFTCLLSVLTLGLQGCGPDTSALSYQEFKDKLKAKSFKGVVRKSDLISTFGKPMRIQQEDGAHVYLYYQIADGMIQIKGNAQYWNGQVKYYYCDWPRDWPRDVYGNPEAPDDPEVAKILAQTGWSRSDLVSNKCSPEQNQRLADWYLKTHPELVLTESQAKSALEPFPAFQLVKRIGPFLITELRDRTNPIVVSNDGRFQMARVEKGRAVFNYNYKTGDENTKELDNSAYKELTDEARRLLEDRNEKYRTKWKKDYEKEHAKVVDEPCLIVYETRVY